MSFRGLIFSDVHSEIANVSRAKRHCLAENKKKEKCIG